MKDRVTATYAWCAGSLSVATKVFACTIVILTLLWWTPVQAASSTVIEIPAGDTAAFLSALDRANKTDGPVIIRLAANSIYELNLKTSPPVYITKSLTIDGQNAQLVGDPQGANFGPLFRVSGPTELEVHDLVIRDFDSGDENLGNSPDGLIAIYNVSSFIGHDLRIENIRAKSKVPIHGGVFTNYNRLSLDRVRISHITVGINLGIVIWSDAETEIQNLLVADSIGETSTDGDLGGTYLVNYAVGKMNVRFSTFLARSDLKPSKNTVYAIINSGGRGIHPTTTVLGSMFVETGCFMTSLGFNLTTRENCQGAAPSDRVGVSPEPLAIRDDYGLEVIPQRGSPALDGVTNLDIVCPLTDALGIRRPQDGNGDGLTRCDIGAFEKKASARLFAGGENGLYYDADQDGHYVTLEEVRPNVYVIKWETFDLNGKQAWIFALGSRQGDTISGDAFIMPQGMLIPGGGAEVNMDALQDWGTMALQLFNCRSGEFRYASSLPQFGSGSFALTRLAMINGLGCR